VAEATSTVLEVDGAGLTLVHADGPPRWVAATDAAVELLAQVQHDVGEGPYLQAYAQDRAVVVDDLGAGAVWTGRLATRTDLHAGAGLEAARHSTSQSPTGRVRRPGSASARPGPCTRPRSADARTRREYHPAQGHGSGVPPSAWRRPPGEGATAPAGQGAVSGDA
jgi:hypothetical protein